MKFEIPGVKLLQYRVVLAWFERSRMLIVYLSCLRCRRDSN